MSQIYLRPEKVRSGTPSISRLLKRTSCWIFWEITNDSSEYVFIANCTFGLCPKLYFSLWRGLASQLIAMYVFPLPPAPSGAHRNICSQVPRGVPNLRWSKEGKVKLVEYFVLNVGHTCQDSVYYAHSVHGIAKLPMVAQNISPPSTSPTQCRPHDNSGHWSDSACGEYVCS